MAGATININKLIAEQKFGGFHVKIILLCALAMFADGFDMQILGYAAPSLTRTLALAPGALGPVFAMSGAGTLLGAFVFTPLADRVGRKPIILGCLFFFAIASLATALATTVGTLTWLRFVTGLGLGGLTPNALALAAEWMPERYKVSRVILVWYGFSIGSTVAGPLTAYILAHYEWQGVFIFAGIPPVLIALWLIKALPESTLFLSRRNAAAARIAANLSRLDPAHPVALDAIFISSEKEEKGFPVILLFCEGRAWMTILLWVMFFANLSALYFMNSWLPTVLTNAGLTESTAIIIAGATHIGGIIGGQIIAIATDRLNRYRVLAGAYLLSAMFIALVGASGDATVLAAFATFFAGFFTMGVQNTANAIATTLYPTALRSSGAGWAMGVGRLAQIAAPWAGGVLLSLQWPSNQILYVVALPALVAVTAAVSIGRVSAARSIVTAPVV